MRIKTAVGLALATFALAMGSIALFGKAGTSQFPVFYILLAIAMFIIAAISAKNALKSNGLSR